MSIIELGDSPKGKEFEEYVSSFFQCAGYYIERNIVEENVLELDIIVTDYKTDIPHRILVEVKSGGWGFTDIFKFKGWMDYLEVSNGYFVVDSKENADVNKKVQKLNIKMFFIQKPSLSHKIFCNELPCIGFDNDELEIWRFSYMVERIMLKNITEKKKTNKTSQRYQALAYCYKKVNDTFFTSNMVDKIDELYSVFQKHPNLSAKTANEIIGNNYDDEYSEIPYSIFSQTYYDCNDTDLNLSTFIEHRSRLAVIKSAIDYISFYNAGIQEKVEKKITIKAQEKNIVLDFFKILPTSFKDGLTEISKHNYYKRYPIFWQYFMWVMGGVLLKDFYDEEIAFLSKKTGIPVDEIPNAIKSYEILFPTDNGWFKDLSPYSNIIVMKMFPVPFMGLGANWRRYLHASSQELKEINVTGKHTLDDLKKWNNLGYHFVEKYQKLYTQN